MNLTAYNAHIKEEFECKPDAQTLEHYISSEALAPIENYKHTIELIRCHREIASYPVLMIGAYLISRWETDENEFLNYLNKNRKRLQINERAILNFLNAHHIRNRETNYQENPMYRKHLEASLDTTDPFVTNRLWLLELEPSAIYAREAMDNIARVCTESDLAAIGEEGYCIPNTFINRHILGNELDVAGYYELAAFLSKRLKQLKRK